LWSADSHVRQNINCPDYGDLISTVAATFKSRQAQSEDCGYGFIEML